MGYSEALTLNSWFGFSDEFSMSAMFKARVVSICAAFLLWATCHAAGAADAVSPPAIFTSGTTPPPDFESLRIKGLNISLPGPQDTIDPDFAGIRSSLASLGIGYIGYSNNFLYNNLLPAERSTFGLQIYNGQKPTFFTNNVMQLTYDLSRYGIPDGQIVLGGIYNFDTWAPGGPNALSLATLSYYQTFLNKQVELKLGYVNNVFEFWSLFLAGHLASSIFGLVDEQLRFLGASMTVWGRKRRLASLSIWLVPRQCSTPADT